MFETCLCSQSRRMFDRPRSHPFGATCACLGPTIFPGRDAITRVTSTTSDARHVDTGEKHTNRPRGSTKSTRGRSTCDRPQLLSRRNATALPLLYKRCALRTRWSTPFVTQPPRFGTVSPERNQSWRGPASDICEIFQRFVPRHSSFKTTSEKDHTPERARDETHTFEHTAAKHNGIQLDLS